MNELTVGDGFRFGCGFFMAGFLTWLVMMGVVLVISLVMGAALSSVFEDVADSMSQLLPLLATM